MRVKKLGYWSFVSSIRQQGKAAEKTLWEMQDIFRIRLILFACFTDDGSKLSR